MIASDLMAVILILAGGIAVSLAARAMGTSPIVGYLLLGVGLGTWSPTLLADRDLVALLSDLGISFLLFDIGLHFSLVGIRRDARDIFGFGPLQVLIAAVMLAGSGWLLGLAPAAAALVGFTLALSSTAVVAALVSERGQRQCPVGMTATSILVFQDLVAILLLVVASTPSAESLTTALSLVALKVAAAVGLVVLVQRLLLRPLLALLARHASEEVFTATALVIAMATGWLALVSGLSLALGAFLGGMIIADSPFRTLIRSEIAPFRNLLVSFFFIAVGAAIDVGMDAHLAVQITIVAVIVVIAKVLANSLASLIFRWSVPGSIQLGFLLAQGSEFAFVILGTALAKDLLGADTIAILTAAVALTLAATPIVSAAGRKLAGRLRTRGSRLYPELRPHVPSPAVLIVGMGRIGRTVADALTVMGIAYDAIERDAQRLRKAVADGYAADFGDYHDTRLWQVVRLKERRLCVVTGVDAGAFAESASLAQSLQLGVRHLVVVADEVSAERIRDAGGEALVNRGEPAGVATARIVLGMLGVDAEAIGRWIAETADPALERPTIAEAA